MEQELLTLPKHLSSPPVFSGNRVALSFVFCVVFCRSSFVLCHLSIVLSVLRFTISDCPFGIFQLFFLCNFSIYSFSPCIHYQLVKYDKYTREFRYVLFCLKSIYRVHTLKIIADDQLQNAMYLFFCLDSA